MRGAREVVWSWAGPPALSLWRETVEHRGRTWTQHGVTANDGLAGVVVLVQHHGRTLWLQHRRPVVGRTLWELPRGFAEGAGDARGEGRRELAEETGIHAVGWERLGTLWADSGLLTNAVVALRADATDPDARPADGEADSVHWLTDEEVRRMVADGEIEDSLSLATLALHWLRPTGPM